MVARFRMRLEEYRREPAPLGAWRELQMELLDAVKQLHRRKASVAHDHASQASHVTLWSMMSEAYWVERDLKQLASMIENVIAELEKHDKPVHG
jgi:hypothetical protein